ncbi:uncharacterized protein LOC121259537 isoform X2 [Juglans microcarpa x Juglans regia]|uniref:uncharacterized protein LOC121259537 isoform X2 n=1 Tax=Juglans microcarpa x Juglans regia TaxID=2249226 RepID=UPI001B7E73FE|nr:uncharacterized protein LOC121259537 isoform X2 [Juglans microcarpa x Juglans regia]
MRLIRICKSLVSLSLENPLPHLHETPTLSCLISVLYFSSSKPKKSTSTVTVLDYLINQHQFSPEAALKASSTFTYLRNPKKADSVLSFFKESGFSQTHIELVVKRMPKVLSAKLAVTIKPIIKIFQDSGFARDDIAEIVSGDPWILTRSAGFFCISRRAFRLSLKRLMEWGLIENLRCFFLPFGQSVQCQKRIGSSSWNFSEVWGFRKKIFLMCLGGCLRFLLYPRGKLRRLKPRLRVLEILEKKNVLNRKPRLSTVCKIPEKKFLNKFVLPYSKELAEVNEAGESSYTIGCVQ